MNFEERYGVYLAAAEGCIDEWTRQMQFKPDILGESMKYTLLSGGKRIRPVLFYAALDAFGADYRREGRFAAAIECIHTYSLIHDDLPAMDNDDFRRGKPSNHRVYGEGNAVLAGDALLSFAFDLLLQASDERHLRAARYLSKAAGAEGMIAGQSADLLYSGKTAGKDDLLFIYKNKTARLIMAPVVCAAILADGDVQAAERYGESLGILFQLTDDILDEKGESARMGKTLGKDRAEDKLTCVKVFGLEESERLADEYAERAKSAIAQKNLNIESEFLIDLVDYVRRRDH